MGRTFSTELITLLTFGLDSLEIATRLNILEDHTMTSHGGKPRRLDLRVVEDEACFGRRSTTSFRKPC